MDQIKQTLSDLMTITNKIQIFLKTAPKENLRTCKKGRNYQFYAEKNKKRTYIAKKNIQEAQKIAQRDYFKKLLPLLLQNTKTIKQFIVQYNPKQLEQCFLSLPQARKQLVRPVFIDDQTFLTQWESQIFEPKKDQPDGSLRTFKNESVRSKSEVIIAHLLYTKKVPYYYEYPLELKNGLTVYPDFLCLNKRTRREIYWEHCGMMDDPEYTSHLTRRLAEYSKKGIFPGQNLILTFETATTPLDTKHVERWIEVFLE